MVASRKQQQLCTSHMQDRSAALVTYFEIGMILENTMATVVVPMSSTVLLVLYMGSIVQCTYDYSSTSVISIASTRLC